MESFPLSFNNELGLCFILDGTGDILLRSEDPQAGPFYDNAFDGLAGMNCRQEDIDALRSAMTARETGSIIFSGDGGSLLYCFAPVESAGDWYLLSVVLVDAIRESADRMLWNLQIALELVALLIILCVVFRLLLWHTQKEITAKNQEVNYQAQRFNIFTAYLANYTDGRPVHNLQPRDGTARVYQPQCGAGTEGGAG